MFRAIKKQAFTLVHRVYVMLETAKAGVSKGKYSTELRKAQLGKSVWDGFPMVITCKWVSHSPNYVLKVIDL